MLRLIRKNVQTFLALCLIAAGIMVSATGPLLVSFVFGDEGSGDPEPGELQLPCCGNSYDPETEQCVDGFIVPL